MQLTVDERRAVEAGVPLRCVVPGTQLTCVILRNDVFAKLQLHVEVIDSDLTVIKPKLRRDQRRRGGPPAGPRAPGSRWYAAAS